MMPLVIQEAQSSPVLEGLNDLVVPEPVSMMPQTVGWVVVCMAVLAVFGVLGFRIWQRHRENAYRRAALALVDTTPLTALPALVKRVVLAAAPRSDTASLTGDAWLAFLDRSYGGDGFTRGPGRALAAASFDPAATGKHAPAELRHLVALWIRKHRV